MFGSGVGNRSPGLAAIVGFIRLAVGVREGSMKIVGCVQGGKIASGRRIEFHPMLSAVPGQQKDPGAAAYPTDFRARRGTGHKVQGHAAFLQFPGLAGVVRALDESKHAYSPEDAVSGCGNGVCAPDCRHAQVGIVGNDLSEFARCTGDGDALGL